MQKQDRTVPQPGKHILSIDAVTICTEVPNQEKSSISKFGFNFVFWGKTQSRTKLNL